MKLEKASIVERLLLELGELMKRYFQHLYAFFSLFTKRASFSWNACIICAIVLHVKKLCSQCSSIDGRQKSTQTHTQTETVRMNALQ